MWGNPLLAGSGASLSDRWARHGSAFPGVPRPAPLVEAASVKVSDDRGPAGVAHAVTLAATLDTRRVRRSVDTAVT